MTSNTTTTSADDLVVRYLHGFTSGVEHTAPGRWMRAIFADTARNNGVDLDDLAAATIARFDALDLDHLADKVRATFPDLPASDDN